jgi:GT2 family glycosyltransferase
MSAPTMNRRDLRGESSRRPRFSVIVPTYRRPDSLQRCLSALTEQTLPREEFEVLIVDDGSAEPPRSLIARHAAMIDVRLIEAKHGGPAAARNGGAAAACGQYLVFTDDDCIPDPNWLSALASTVDANPGRAVGGAVINALRDGLCSTASQLLIDFLYEYYNVDANGGRFFITANLAFPARQFLAAGGFDVTFPLAAAEDRDMCDRWLELGHEIVYCEGAVVRHAHALRLGSFARQHFNYGRGAHHLQRARARRGMTEIVVEPPHFYSRLVGYPFRHGVTGRTLVLSGLLLLTQISYAVGYFSERLRFAQLRHPSPARPRDQVGAAR